MSQQTTLSSFFKREPKRERGEGDDDHDGGKKKTHKAVPAELAAVKQRVRVAIKAEKAHKESKADAVRSSGLTVDVKFDFALPANVRDEAGRRPDDPSYDGRTVLVPQEQFLKMTSFERQFWEVKRRLFDTVVFFRKGMFYELFEEDARIMHRELGTAFTLRASMVMCGFPATQFEERSGVLLAKGYRVARVDQSETSLGLDKRARAGGRVGDDAKVIRRTVTEILTPGTLQDPGLAGSAQAPRTIAVWEGEGRVFGVCVVECATHTLMVGSFRDDARLSHLETLLLQTVPKEALLCKGACSAAATSLIRRSVGTRTLVHVREAGEDFWEPERAKRTLEGAFDTTRVPRVLQMASVGEGDAPLLWATGGVLAYLEELGVLQAILISLKMVPFDALPVGHVALDGSTLSNLNILGSDPTSLLSLVDHTVTPQGSRQMRQWCCAPLVDTDAIADRLNAIDVLRANGEWTNQLRAELKHVPDLERLAALCATGTCSVAKLAGLVLGIERAWEALSVRFVCNTALRSKAVKYLAYVGESKALEDAGALSATCGALLTERLFSIVKSWSAVKETGVLEPLEGADEQRDAIRARMHAVEQRLQELLASACKAMGSRDVVFLDVGKTRYLLDAPAAVRDRAVKSGFTLVNSTKSRDRFTSKDCEKEVAALADLEDELLLRRNAFVALVQKNVASVLPEIADLSLSVARLDCLVGLASFVNAHPGELCRPLVLPRAGRQSYLEAEELRHPLSLSSGHGDHIANSVSLGGPAASCMLITGPNMGGKSTLLRAVCLNVIMAQIGCWVPCTSFRMTAVDRVFTRIGARDDILAGQSTFMVEMLETSAVLNHASADSLVVLDELGRGTSTHDGHAVAYATLRELEMELGCRTLFSTHYLQLADEFKECARVEARRMSHLIAENKHLVFLYKLVPGVTPSSFGMNVARLAGVEEPIVARAEALAKEAQFGGEGDLEARLREAVRRVGWSGE